MDSIGSHRHASKNMDTLHDISYGSSNSQDFDTVAIYKKHKNTNIFKVSKHDMDFVDPYILHILGNEWLVVLVSMWFQDLRPELVPAL